MLQQVTREAFMRSARAGARAIWRRRRRWVPILVVLLALRLLVSGVLIWGYTLPHTHVDGRAFNLEERKHRYEQYVRLRSIWQARHQRDVGAEIVPFLSDPLVTVRRDAVHKAGRLESPATARALRRVQRDGSGHRPIAHYELAIARSRVRARWLPGLLRLHCAMSSTGLTLLDLWPLASQVNNTSGSRYRPGTGNGIVWEMADLVYTLEKRGALVGLVARTVEWSEPQRVVIQAGRLSDEEEIRFLVQWLSTRQVMTADSWRVVDHLEEKLGPEAVPVIADRLKQMRASATPYSHIGYDALFDVLAGTGGSEATAAVADFRNHPDGDVRHCANQAYERLTSTGPKF